MPHPHFSLILGGWAARWLAHIGIISYLEEHSLIPSQIVGTSIGAIIGAFYACGYTSREMHEIIGEISWIWLIDIDMRHGGIKWEKMVAFLERYFWEKNLEDTDMPLTIIATDLQTGEKVSLKQGPILSAIRASISIPGVFAPYHYTWRHLIDGGIASNLAIEEAASVYPAVGVSVQIRESEHRDVQTFLGNFFSWPSLILRQALQLMMLRNESISIKSHPNPLILTLDMRDIEYYDFLSHETLIHAGYDLAKPILHYLSSYDTPHR